VHDIQPVDELGKLGKPGPTIDVERLEDQCDSKALFPEPA
jgi:hypothetical protein